MHWWEYYKFKKEPFLDSRPLMGMNDLDIFWGRTKELHSVQMRADTANKVCLLITGNAGIGKTSFLCKAFQKDSGFIRVNLSKARNAGEADSEIARSFVSSLKSKRIKASDLDKRIKTSTSKTTGHTLQATIAGTGAKSINQKTESLERNYETEDVIEECCKRLSLKTKRIIVTLDESDFLGSEQSNDLVNLCQRIKEIIPPPGILIMVNRDAENEFNLSFADTTSLVRSIFDHHERLNPLWKPGEEEIKVILDPRFKRGNPSRAYEFPIAKDACFIIDALSSGNIREMLRYTKHVLMEGMIAQVEIPLSGEFVLNSLIENYKELRIGPEEDFKILNHLKQKPSSISDKEFQKAAGSKSAVHRRLQNLEKLGLVERDEVSPGKKQTYSVTKKTEILLGVRK